jgi:uncharacterized protein (DUF1330 family)
VRSTVDRYGAAITPTTPVTLCVTLTAKPGAAALLVEYEDQVLGLLPAHGGRVVQRVRALDASSDPLEIQVVEFPSEDALERYLQDPARVALSDLRDRAIARTELLRVSVVAPERLSS